MESLPRNILADTGPLIGIVPYDRERVAQGAVKRVFEAVYAKLLDREGDLLRPDPRNLTPATRALFEALFSATVGARP